MKRDPKRYANVDWTKPIPQIAKELGVVRGSVYFAKSRIGKTHARPKKSMLATWEDWTLTDKEIAERIGCCKDTVRFFRAEHGISKVSTIIKRVKVESLWIKCADRLPEILERVVVYGKREHTFSFSHDRPAYQYHAQLLEEGVFICQQGNVIAATHWMPLPSPPED